MRAAFEIPYRDIELSLVQLDTGLSGWDDWEPDASITAADFQQPRKAKTMPAAREFYYLKVPRPKHPELKRRWKRWAGDVMVRRDDQKVFILDVMQPHHLMSRLPCIGTPECFEHDYLAFVDIDWGIARAADAKEREHYQWLKTYALSLVSGDGKEPYLPPVYPKVSGRGRNMTLMLGLTRHYELTGDRQQFLDLLRHISKKTWFNDDFLRLAVDRVATACGWDARSILVEFERGF